MKEIRTIKRSFTQDETLGSLPRDARLLFVGLICIVDDHGRFRAHPSLVRSSVFPYDDDLSAANCGELLRALQAAGRIVLWDQDGQTYGEIVNWSKHQRVDNAARSDLPERPPSANCGEPPQPAANHGDPALERRGKDRKGTTPLPPTNGTVVDLPTKPRARRQAPSGECDPEFQEWYALYPRKEAPKDAAKAWVQMRRDASAEDIIAGLHRALPDLEAKKPARGERDFRPLPASWLRAGRWLDGVGESKQPKGESKLCGKCDQYAFKGSGRCGNGQTVAQIAETAQIIEQPEIEVCRGWEWIRDGREEPAVGRVLRVDHRRA